MKAILASKFSGDNYESELKEVISKIWKEDYRKMQDEYDAETNYARMFQAQIDWNKLISDKLIELKEYNDTEITVTFE
ncbi:hypothetical protein OAD50_02225 [Vicingaceae bacterium]|nr:hypothetical protein [Vicingaceae bacterium]MDB9963876.1 hypothetical protein [Vicingaceae bacterium]